MQESIVEKVRNNPKYQRLVKTRSFLGWFLSAVVCAIYYGFILVIALHKDWLGTRINPDEVITWGIPIGVGVIVSSFVLTGVYVLIANSLFDRLTREIKEDIK
ncbi:DUF485 domain-containing protein [Beggiatoa leptomitoformis]|uniref:DUF485 domain-containing protein n=1 Tax=Beggiatoa leptomitoformis TaxID=288004 RepID=A0A2N9YF24_9GAMM|nr:DUF485 domain-containing protein [Beggiatoa leptomitoformis]ALG68618.1 DUF485 domain-containing protein [Beggiatoa leptomitoformis]AUI69036.1 DUF485 domain-containing protein [Beggiatoa leptomitoformis]